MRAGFPFGLGKTPMELAWAANVPFAHGPDGKRTVGSGPLRLLRRWQVEVDVGGTRPAGRVWSLRLFDGRVEGTDRGHTHINVCFGGTRAAALSGVCQSGSLYLQTTERTQRLSAQVERCSQSSIGESPPISRPPAREGPGVPFAKPHDDVTKGLSMTNVLVGRTEDGREVYVEARIEDCAQGKRLALTGVVLRNGGSLRRDNDWVSSGQIGIDVLREIVRPAPGWTVEDARQLADVWDRWHLNDMRAGCEHQRADGWGERRIDPDKPTDTYGLHFEGQRAPSWNLLVWVRPGEHPDGLLGKPCEVCGYRYGTAWLYEPVPEDVLAFVAERLLPVRPD